MQPLRVHQLTFLALFFAIALSCRLLVNPSPMVDWHRVSVDGVPVGWTPTQIEAMLGPGQVESCRGPEGEPLSLVTFPDRPTAVVYSQSDIWVSGARLVRDEAAEPATLGLPSLLPSHRQRPGLPSVGGFFSDVKRCFGVPLGASATELRYTDRRSPVASWHELIVQADDGPRSLETVGDPFHVPLAAYFRRIRVARIEMHWHLGKPARSML